MIAAALVLACLAAQEPAAPPPPMDATPPGETAPAPAADAPATPPPPPATTAPPAAAKPKVPAPDKKAAPEGMSPFVVVGIQACVGCITAIVAAPLLNLVPGIGALLTPAVVGAVEGILGDMLGQQRAGLIWPILGAYVGQICIGVPLVIVGVIAGYAIGAAGFVALMTAVTSGGLTNPALLLPIVFGVAAGFVIPIVLGAVLALAAEAITPAVFYMIFAEDKKPGDTGQGFPGIVEPAHPAPEPKKASVVVPSDVRAAMAY